MFDLYHWGVYGPLTQWWESLSSKDRPWQLWTSITETVATLGIQGKTLMNSVRELFFNWLLEKKKAQFHFEHDFFFVAHEDKSEFNRVTIFYKSNQGYSGVKVTFLPACLLLLGFLLTYWTGMHCAGLVNFPTLASLMCLWLPMLLGYYSLIRSVHFFLFFILLSLRRKKKLWKFGEVKCWKCAKLVCL